MALFQSRRNHPRPSLASPADSGLFVVALLAHCSGAQPASLPPAPPAEALPGGSAGFTYITGGGGAPDASTPEPPPDPATWNLGATPPPAPEAAGTGPRIEQLMSDAWILSQWTPPVPDGDGQPETSLALTPVTASAGDSTTSRMDRWARGVFSADAELLTPLTPGRQMFAWRVANGVTLAGVGSRRAWDERNRTFVLSAEAGFDLTPGLGLHFGYEVFQASAAALADPAGEGLFARLQLRF